MAFGAYAPLPLRLGGDAQEGWSPEQHARLCADLLAVKFAAPLAAWVFTKNPTATITSYSGQNGSGLLWAPEVEDEGTGESEFSWPSQSFTDPYGVLHPVRIRCARVTPIGSTAIIATSLLSLSSVLSVRTFNAAGAATNCACSVVVW